MILDRKQLFELTGAKRPKEIIEWLQAQFFTYVVKRDGWPAVHADHVRERLGAKQPRGHTATRVYLDHLPGAKHGKTTQDTPGSA